MATASRSIRQSVQELTPADFDLLTGIDPEIAISAKLGRVDSFTARDMTGHGGSFDKSGIAIPYYFSANTEGEPGEWAVRLDHPPLGDIGKDGQLKESRKYLWPVGQSNLFYIHPNFFKHGWLADTSIPVVFVEGVKKALALTGLAFHGLSDAVEKPRFIVASINGVEGWKTKIGIEKNADGTDRRVTGPLPDFGLFRWNDREAVIIFDANVATNWRVKYARTKLANHLSSLSVEIVRYVDLPQIEGVNGVDDLIGLWGKDRVLDLVKDEAYDSTTYPLTDYGNSKRFIRLYGDDVRFCCDLGKNDTGKWLTWATPRWQIDGKKNARELAKETIQSMKEDASRLFKRVKPELERLQAELAVARDETQKAKIEKQIEKLSKEPKELLAWQKKSEQKRNTADLLWQAETDDVVCITRNELDQHRLLFNAPNGTIDLERGELREACREDLLTQTSPVRYDPKAKCPKWEKFLAEVFEGHEDLIPFIQTFAGYCLSGLTKEEYLFVLWGEGRNGKGTFLGTLLSMLGDYGTTVDFNTFVDKGKNDSGPRDDVANMRSKRLVVSQESREGAPLAEAHVKTLTGGDAQRARKLYENSSVFEPTAKLVLATNYKPKINGDDIGIWSRIKLIPFTVSFEGREDKNLKKDLLSELPGILTWAVEGYKTYAVEGLVFPPSVADATAEYKKESDALGEWLEQRCLMNETLSKYSFELHANYESWCIQAHEKKILPSRAFGRRLSKVRGITTSHGAKGTIYTGIGFKPDGRDSYDND